MKILLLDGLPCLYPDGINSIDDFIEYVNDNITSFIPMTELVTKDCVYPYLVEEDTMVRYINMSLVKSILEDDVEILSRFEYDERLKDLQEEICIHCMNYSENLDPDADNLEGHRDEMRLDGFCPNFQPIDDDEEV